MHRGTYLAPSLMSSGQEWYGPEGLASDPTVRERVLESITRNGKNGSKRNTPRRVKATDSFLREALSIIQDAAIMFRQQPPLVRTAFPEGQQALEAAHAGVISGVWLCVRVHVCVCVCGCVSLCVSACAGHSAASAAGFDA